MTLQLLLRGISAKTRLFLVKFYMIIAIAQNVTNIKAQANFSLCALQETFIKEETAMESLSFSQNLEEGTWQVTDSFKAQREQEQYRTIKGFAWFGEVSWGRLVWFSIWILSGSPNVRTTAALHVFIWDHRIASLWAATIKTDKCGEVLAEIIRAMDAHYSVGSA